MTAKHSINGVIKLAMACMCIFALSGCLSYRCQEVYPENAITSYDIDGVMGAMARDMCGNMCFYDKDSTAKPERQNILVADFVPYRGKSVDRIGQYIGESMRLAVKRECCAKVELADLESHFSITQSGVFKLTVPYAHPDSVVKPSLVVVGSYGATNDDVTFRAEAVDPISGEIKDSVKRSGETMCILGKRRALFPPPAPTRYLGGIRD